MYTIIEINKLLETDEWCSYDNLYKIKYSLPTFLWNSKKSKFFYEKTEKEVENNTDVYKLKQWEILQPLVDNIIDDIKYRINLKEIDFLTFTPDSWNNVDEKVELKWFSIICKYISEKLEKPLLVPDIVKKMRKQKTQNSSNRINNKRWGYSFDQEIIRWKKILFIDDVITSWSTMCAIWEDIVKKGWFFMWYWISLSELDNDNK